MAQEPPADVVHAYLHDNGDARFRSWCSKLIAYSDAPVLPAKNRQNGRVSCLPCLENIVEKKAEELDRAKRTHDVSAQFLAHLRSSLDRQD